MVFFPHCGFSKYIITYHILICNENSFLDSLYIPLTLFPVWSQRHVILIIDVLLYVFLMSGRAGFAFLFFLRDVLWQEYIFKTNSDFEFLQAWWNRNGNGTNLYIGQEGLNVPIR